jgi:hypothetical protein
MWWVVNVTSCPLYPREWDPVTVVEEAVWAPGPVWMGAEHLAPTEIRSPERLARSESLYRLRYADPQCVNRTIEIYAPLQLSRVVCVEGKSLTSYIHCNVKLPHYMRKVWKLRCLGGCIFFPLSFLYTYGAEFPISTTKCNRGTSELQVRWWYVKTRNLLVRKWCGLICWKEGSVHKRQQ